MPTPKQMEKMAAAAAVGRSEQPMCTPGPGDEMPPEYWQALLADASADVRPSGSNVTLRLTEIPHHLLRVGCRRCGRTVEIQKVDAIRLYGPEAAWKNVGQRLLDDTCRQRTGRHEEDGCWPAF